MSMIFEHHSSFLVYKNFSEETLNEYYNKIKCLLIIKKNAFFCLFSCKNPLAFLSISFYINTTFIKNVLSYSYTATEMVRKFIPKIFDIFGKNTFLS